MVNSQRFNIKNSLKIATIIITIAIFVVSTAVWAFSPKKNLTPSEYNIGTTYELAVRDKKPFIALFYTDWCTYCMRFMPKYKIIEDIYKDKYNFVMINAENPAYDNLIADYAVESFPTVYIIDSTIDNRILINNALYDNLGKLRTEFDRYLRIRAMIK